MFSIVIPTYNRIDSLKKCLDSIDKQTFDRSKFEVIVVDDGSEKDVAKMLSLCKYSFKLFTIRIDHAGPAQARNIGAKHAINNYIIFFEDDIVVDNSYLEVAYNILCEGKYDVVEGKTMLSGRKREIRHFDEENVFSFIPCNLIIRRELFVKLGGYDTNFFDFESGLYFREDADLGFRLLEIGALMLKTDKLIVEHPEQFTDISLCFRHSRRYFFDPLLYKKHPKLYRKYIEKKRILGIILCRPIHKISWMALLDYFFICFSLLQNLYYLADISFFTLLIISSILQIKYMGISLKSIMGFIPRLIPFCFLPIVYFFSLVKGCVKFKSYGCLF